MSGKAIWLRKKITNEKKYIYYFNSIDIKKNKMRQHVGKSIEV